jgi:hypothetical protein
MENPNNIKIVSKYSFNNSIDKVFKTITDTDITRVLMKDEINDLQFIKGQRHLEEGAIYSLSHKLVTKIYIIVNKVISNDNFKFIHQRSIKIEPSEYHFFMNLFLYWNSIEKETVYVKELYICKNLFSLLKLQLYQSCERERLKLMDDLMRQDETQEESIMLDVDMEKLWYIITDWREFIKYVPMIGKSVEYYDEPRSIGTKFDVDDGNNIYSFIVTKADINELEAEFVLDLEYNTNSPRQVVTFKLNYVDNYSTFLTFKHCFKDPIRLKKITLLSKQKKQILQSLKNALICI